MKSNLNNRVFDSVYGTFFSLYKYYKIYFIILFICLIAAYFYTSSPKTYNLVYDSKSSINSDTYDNIFNFHKILDFDPELLYHLEKQDVLDNELRTQILSKISTKIENHIRNLNEEKFVLLNDNIKNLDKNLINKIINCIKKPELVSDGDAKISLFTQITCSSQDSDEINIIAKYIDIAIEKITLKSSKDTIDYLLNYYQSNMSSYLNDYTDVIKNKRFYDENGNINDLLAYVFDSKVNPLFNYQSDSYNKERVKRIFSSKFYEIIKEENFYKTLFIISNKNRIYNNDKGYVPFLLSFIASLVIYLILVIIIDNMKDYLRRTNQQN